jgi:MinD superfamily P-loop ATPase
LHDLKRVHELVKKFNIDSGCIINKSDLNSNVAAEIETFLEKENIKHISNIPYNESFSRAIINGQTLIEYDNETIKTALIKSWERILKHIYINKQNENSIYNIGTNDGVRN